MAEVTNELIYEVLKAMQIRLSNIEQGQVEIRTELRAMRGHLNAMQTDIANLYNSVDALERRVARIEQRLELVDAPST
jgi:polyhydroxyalkanoate synthesis regulator phasin